MKQSPGEKQALLLERMLAMVWRLLCAGLTGGPGLAAAGGGQQECAGRITGEECGFWSEHGPPVLVI